MECSHNKTLDTVCEVLLRKGSSSIETSGIYFKIFFGPKMFPLHQKVLLLLYFLLLYKEGKEENIFGVSILFLKMDIHYKGAPILENHHENSSLQMRYQFCEYFQVPGKPYL